MEDLSLKDLAKYSQSSRDSKTEADLRAWLGVKQGNLRPDGGVLLERSDNPKALDGPGKECTANPTVGESGVGEVRVLPTLPLRAAGLTTASCTSASTSSAPTPKSSSEAHAALPSPSSSTLTPSSANTTTTASKGQGTPVELKDSSEALDLIAEEEENSEDDDDLSVSSDEDEEEEQEENKELGGGNGEEMASEEVVTAEKRPASKERKADEESPGENEWVPLTKVQGLLRMFQTIIKEKNDKQQQLTPRSESGSKPMKSPRCLATPANASPMTPSLPTSGAANTTPSMVHNYSPRPSRTVSTPPSNSAFNPLHRQHHYTPMSNTTPKIPPSSELASSGLRSPRSPACMEPPSTSIGAKLPSASTGVETPSASVDVQRSSFSFPAQTTSPPASVGNKFSSASNIAQPPVVDLKAASVSEVVKLPSASTDIESVSVSEDVKFPSVSTKVEAISASEGVKLRSASTEVENASAPEVVKLHSASTKVEDASAPEGVKLHSASTKVEDASASKGVELHSASTKVEAVSDSEGLKLHSASTEVEAASASEGLKLPSADMRVKPPSVSISAKSPPATDIKPPAASAGTGPRSSSVRVKPPSASVFGESRSASAGTGARAASMDTGAPSADAGALRAELEHMIGQLKAEVSSLLDQAASDHTAIEELEREKAVLVKRQEVSASEKLRTGKKVNVEISTLLVENAELHAKNSELSRSLRALQHNSSRASETAEHEAHRSECLTLQLLMAQTEISMLKIAQQQQQQQPETPIKKPLAARALWSNSPTPSTPKTLETDKVRQRRNTGGNTENVENCSETSFSGWPSPASTYRSGASQFSNREKFEKMKWQRDQAREECKRKCLELEALRMKAAAAEARLVALQGQYYNN